MSSVEVVGGSTRVPSVLRQLTDFFGREPSRTLNAKETVSRGCALQCAMLSPTFRVRDFQVLDSFPYGVQFRWVKGWAGRLSGVGARVLGVPAWVRGACAWTRRCQLSICAGQRPPVNQPACRSAVLP